MKKTIEINTLLLMLLLLVLKLFMFPQMSWFVVFLPFSILGAFAVLIFGIIFWAFGFFYLTRRPIKVTVGGKSKKVTKYRRIRGSWRMEKL